jgi:hypothetical protein
MTQVRSFPHTALETGEQVDMKKMVFIKSIVTRLVKDQSQDKCMMTPMTTYMGTAILPNQETLERRTTIVVFGPVQDVAQVEILV